MRVLFQFKDANDVIVQTRLVQPYSVDQIDLNNLWELRIYHGAEYHEFDLDPLDMLDIRVVNGAKQAEPQTIAIVPVFRELFQQMRSDILGNTRFVHDDGSTSLYKGTGLDVLWTLGLKRAQESLEKLELDRSTGQTLFVDLFAIEHTGWKREVIQ